MVAGRLAAGSSEADWPLVGNKTGATRLGFAALLKFCEIEGRFPACPEEVPGAAVDYLAGLVKVEPEAFAKYSILASSSGLGSLLCLHQARRDQLGAVEERGGADYAAIGVSGRRRASSGRAWTTRDRA